MSSERLFLWTGHGLVENDTHDDSPYAIDAADSLLVRDGRAFALELHRERFTDAVETMSVGQQRVDLGELPAFWNAAFALVPSQGDWFPRVELRSTNGESHLALRLRVAPQLTRALTVATHLGPDPRRKPTVKGPDLEVLVATRASAKARGADDVVILTDTGHIIDGATNAVVWWRDDALCAPPLDDTDSEFSRVSSVTAKSVLGIAAVLGIDTRTERARPEDLEGSEVWALNALHGIRMVTGWVDGPKLAELPGRIRAWRHRRDALFTPIGE